MFDDIDTRIVLEELNGVCDTDPFDNDKRAPFEWIIDTLADALDGGERAALCAIRNLGDKAFKRNGTLNVNKISRMTGLPQRTLYRRIIAVKAAASVMSLYS